MSGKGAWESGQGWTCHRCDHHVRVGEIHVCRGVQFGTAKIKVSRV